MVKTTAEVIACTIANLRKRADQYDQDARLATHHAQEQTQSARDFTDQARLLREAADILEAATLHAS